MVIVKLLYIHFIPIQILILSKHKINCFNYKIWSSETILNWSKMQEHLKRTGEINCSNRKKSLILKKIEQGIL